MTPSYDSLELCAEIMRWNIPTSWAQRSLRRVSAFSKKYSDEQVEAVVSAVLDGVPDQPGSGPLGRGTPVLGREMTAREAQRAASEGRLPGVPAFEINLSTVRNYAQDARRDRDGRKPNRLDRKQPADAADEVFRRVLRMADATLRRAETKAKSSKGLDLRELREMFQISQEVDKAAKQRMTAPSSKTSESTRGTKDQDAGEGPNDFAARLAAQGRDTPGPSDQTSQYPQTMEERETVALPPAQPPEENNAESEDRVPVRAGFSSAQLERAGATVDPVDSAG